MKKTLVLVLSLILCGCSLFKDEYSDYEHYDLRDYNHKTFSYYRTQDVEEYAVSVLSPKGESLEGYMNGLLYKVDENDYILLDTFGVSHNEEYDESAILSYKDKIYILKNIIIEYTLNKKDTKRKNLSFNVSKIMNAEDISLMISSINEVNDDYIYLTGSINGYTNNKPIGSKSNINMKCSLKDYECIEIK